VDKLLISVTVTSQIRQSALPGIGHLFYLLPLKPIQTLVVLFLVLPKFSLPDRKMSQPCFDVLFKKTIAMP
jgi:hypothetical protein